VSLTEALDLTTPTGQPMAEILAIVVESERKILHERVGDGIARARREGRPRCRPPTASLKSDEVSRLKTEGRSHSEIAWRLKIGRSEVRRILRAAGWPTPRCQAAHSGQSEGDLTLTVKSSGRDRSEDNRQQERKRVVEFRQGHAIRDAPRGSSGIATPSIYPSWVPPGRIRSSPASRFRKRPRRVRATEEIPARP
jgi:hypothetical protein